MRRAGLDRSATSVTACARLPRGCAPAAVTAATMLSDSDRAPDSTATVPLGNVVGSCSASSLGIGSKLSDSGSTSFDGTSPRRPAPTFPEMAAIL